MKTIKLYDTDSHLSTFSANVVSCFKENDRFAVILDATAFFPEGGGQSADKGTLGEATVLDVQENGGVITHYTDNAVSGEVECKIDWNTRFRRMQNHSGEHIVSGIVHNIYGYDNVGFHMGDVITVDFNGELNGNQLREVEFLANKAVSENVNITAIYPESETLKALTYRSKLDLTENVRIVTIDGYDVCACCAPHVSKSGEIGMIKILDFMRHRGGTRITMLSGLDALDDCNIKYDNLSEIAVKLCAKQNETAKIFNKYVDDTNVLRAKIGVLNRKIVELKCMAFEKTDINILIFEDELDMQNLRILVLKGAEFAPLCAGFSGNDKDGYSYAISSNSMNLRDMAKELNSALSGKGGGSSELIQGSVSASEKQIRAYFDK